MCCWSPNDGHYLAKVLTEKGSAFLQAAGWKTAADEDAAGPDRRFEKGGRSQNRIDGSNR